MPGPKIILKKTVSKNKPGHPRQKGLTELRDAEKRGGELGDDYAEELRQLKRRAGGRDAKAEMNRIKKKGNCAWKNRSDEEASRRAPLRNTTGLGAERPQVCDPKTCKVRRRTATKIMAQAAPRRGLRP